jgi:hypothetical protein
MARECYAHVPSVRPRVQTLLEEKVIELMSRIFQKAIIVELELRV